MVSKAQMERTVDKWFSDWKKYNIFGKFGNNDVIPQHGSNKSNGVSFSVVNMAVVISLCWLLASVGMFGFGIWHCRNRASSYSFQCDKVDCDLFRNQEMPVRLLRKDITGANSVRIDADAKVIDTSGMRSKAQRRFGHSVEIKYQYASDPSSRFKAEKKILFALEDMGSGPARRVSKDFSKFIYKPDEPVDIYDGFSVTAVGLSCVIFGFLGAVLALIFGQWQDVPKRIKKSS